MPRKVTHTVVRCPDSDWENLMDAVTLEGGNREDVWDALENLEYFSEPWLIIIIKNDKVSARIFSNQKSAQAYGERVKKRYLVNVKVYCIKGQYQNTYNNRKQT